MKRHDTGFTIIELMLAMTFITVLLIMVALTIMQLGNMYTRGMTLTVVEQAGRSLVQDVRYTLRGAPSIDVSSDNVASYKLMPLSGQSGSIGGGRLCTGVYSYVWNLGSAFETPVNVYESRRTEPIRFVKVQDSGAKLCRDLRLPIRDSAAEEMIDGGIVDLAVHKFQVVRTTSPDNRYQSLYFMELEIGTNDKDSIDQPSAIGTADTSCRPPSDKQALADYCAINKFEFTVLTNNAGGR